MDQTRRTFLPWLSLVCVGLISLAAVVWGLGHRSQRTMERFVAEMARGQYAQAQQQLAAPSALLPTADGSLEVVDHLGNRHRVPRARLPFLVLGDRSDDRANLALIALQGDLADPNLPPPISLHLNVTWRGLQIVRVEP